MRAALATRIPSSAWRTAREALEHGPVLVQVGRPGYAPGLACVDCGQLARCELLSCKLGNNGGVCRPQFGSGCTSQLDGCNNCP